MSEHGWTNRQSGAIPFLSNGEFKILIITNRKGTKWVIPKGIVEPELKPAESAAKEVYEEAGIRGRIIKPAIGKYNVKKWGDKRKVKVFLLETEEILESWPESLYRRRKWITCDEAPQYIKKKKLLKIIEKIPDFITYQKNTIEN
jgi:8-oxo-dGTP pyrophosphatase MutT (NUDIX family)